MPFDFIRWMEEYMPGAPRPPARPARPLSVNELRLQEDSRRRLANERFEQDVRAFREAERQTLEAQVREREVLLRTRQPEIQTQNTRFTRLNDGTVVDNGPQPQEVPRQVGSNGGAGEIRIGGGDGTGGTFARTTWGEPLRRDEVFIRSAPLPLEPVGEAMPAEDISDEEQAFLQTFSLRQIEKITQVSLSYLNSYGDIATSHINRWMADEWGRKIADKYYGVAYKMALRRKKEDAKPKPPFLEQTFKQALGSRVKSVKGEIGLELEVEGANLFNSPVEWWTAIADGSLRAYKGLHPPVEYVLREPVGRKDVEPALRYLSDRLKSNKSEIVMSHRCSVHVHLNIQQMKMIHLLNFMSLYYIFEDVLMEHAAPERRGNLFCLRAKDASLQIENLVMSIQTGQWANMMQNDYRYSAMNPAAMSQHGSLEFRAMRGTVDISVIKDWVTILLALKDSASKFLNPASISRIFKSLGPKEFLFRVFDGRIPPEILRRWDGDKLTPERIQEGYQAVRDVLFAIDWASPPEHMTGGVKVRPVIPEDGPEFDRDRDDDDD